MLREHIEAGDELGREVRDTLRHGSLVPDDMVNRLVEARIERPDAKNGFILDGYPRTLNQAEVMSKSLRDRDIASVVIHLQVDYNKIIARLTGRRVCPVCGTLYSLSSNPPKVEGICDKEGARLITREDDSEPVIRQRLEDYAIQTKPLLEYFERSGVPCFHVDGSDGTPVAIAARICGFISEQ
jgi:adenylate kinase